jgi:NAD(P)-dependent dehydrogenase (short-subunit alcohol dehydrogenase family)
LLDLSGKVAIVTGASSGIGRSIAHLFAERRASVILADIDDSGGREALRTIREKGGKADFLHTDVSRLKDLERMVKGAVVRFGRLDILVNNAGIAIFKGSMDTSAQEYQQMMDVNLRSMVFGSKFAARAMKGHQGAIVNIASVNAVAPSPLVVVYSATKGGVISLTLALATEYAPMGIRVNAILPGAIDTSINDKLPGTKKERADRQARTLKRILLGRMGKPLDIAYGALYLVSDEASYVTGSSLLIDGGYLLAT